ncbi:MAG: hypothetical protein PHD05_00010 [Sphaerochaetaceae bacterium]|nr:hypothetical protein [Sphaerochaetaceae bacterium]
MFYNEILNKYKTINFPLDYSEVIKIDKHISWYLADSTNQFITVSKNSNLNILEVDIRQAFTSICNCLFPPNSNFIQQMNKITDKKSRNIFIATQLVNTEYLKKLNIISKLIILGIIFEIDNTVTLLELKKDGVIICCSDETLFKLSNIDKNTIGPFINFIVSNKFSIHITEFRKYIRNNRTSYLLGEELLLVKGIYKHSPQFLFQLQSKIMNNEVIDYDELLKIYSLNYYKIIINNHLNSLLNQYYLCDNQKVINSNSKYITSITEIDPEIYLKLFIYPLVLASKL